MFEICISCYNDVIRMPLIIDCLSFKYVDMQMNIFVLIFWKLEPIIKTRRRTAKEEERERG